MSTATDPQSTDNTEQFDSLTDEPADGAIIAKVDRNGDVLRVMQRNDDAAARNAAAGDDPDEHWFTIPDDIDTDGPWTWDALDEDLVGFERLIRLYRDGEVQS